MQTEAEAVAEMLSEASSPEIVTTDAGRQFLVVPKGSSHYDVTEKNGVLVNLTDRINQAVTLQTVESLIDYANRFKTDTSVLFANMETSAVVLAVDYHGHEDVQPLTHTATMQLKQSVEWKTWTNVADRLMSQIEFARFLEENAADVKAPAGADLLEACRDLQATRKVDFKKAVRTATNNESFEYSDETKATSGGIDLPTRFLLQMPIYFDGEVVNPAAFLRWHLDDGSLNLGFVLQRAEHLRQEVFKRVVARIAKDTGLPAVFGVIGKGA